MKTKPNAQELEYMGRVARLGCAICRRMGFEDSPAEVHHKRAGQGRMRASHYETIPLCYEHHRGNTGIHQLGTKRFVVVYGVTEAELVTETQRLLNHDKQDDEL